LALELSGRPFAMGRVFGMNQLGDKRSRSGVAPPDRDRRAGREGVLNNQRSRSPNAYDPNLLWRWRDTPRVFHRIAVAHEKAARVLSALHVTELGRCAARLSESRQVGARKERGRNNGGLPNSCHICLYSMLASSRGVSSLDLAPRLSGPYLHTNTWPVGSLRQQINCRVRTPRRGELLV
jgi:hypothetical protein